MSNNSQTIHDHESPVRKLLSEAGGAQYTSVPGLAEAKKTLNCYVVMEGDGGGQVYLVAPASSVKCNEEALQGLLAELDAQAWKDASMAGLYYEVHEPGTVVGGGMGGGRAEHSLWVHADLTNLKEQIQGVLSGTARSINT